MSIATQLGLSRAAVAYCAALGVILREVLTDNGACFRSRAFAATCRDLGLVHRFTRPYTLREWAYARAYHRSSQRIAELPRCLHNYNRHGPHASLASHPYLNSAARGTIS